MKHPAILFVALVWLSGCDMPSLSSMAALSKVDPMTTDPAQIRLAVTHPDTVKISPTGLSFRGTLSASESQPEDVFNFQTARAVSGPAENRLASQLSDGDVLSVLRIDPNKLDAFLAFRAKSLDKQRRGSISVSATPCISSLLPPAEINVTVHIRTAELADYVELVGQTDVARELTSEQFASAFSACE